jgi:uncharacterized membrane protein YjjP (DUF1212 family)
VAVTTLFDLLFAAATVVAALALAGAAFRLLARPVLGALALLVSGGAVAGWVLYALRRTHPRELAVAAGGLTACAVAGAASLVLRRTLVRAEAIDANLAAAQARLTDLVDREA